MLTTFSESYKTPIFARSASELVVGFLVDMVINPDTGIFEALWINSIEGQKLLLPKDIIYWNHEKILTDDINNLVFPKELPRLQKIFDKECTILGATVFSNQQVKPLGKVKNFSFDTISPRILTLEISQGFLGLSKQIITQQNINKITPKGIWINEPTAKIKIEKLPLKEEVKNLKNLGEVDIKSKIDKE